MTLLKQEMVDIYAGLKTQWGILKDDKKTKKERTVACARICVLSETGKEVDPKFEMIDMNNTKYAEFLPTKYVSKSDVNWLDPIKTEEWDTELGKAHDTLDMLESLAIMRTRQRLPNERDDSQKFGMIVSAYTDKYIALYIHFDN